MLLPKLSFPISSVACGNLACPHDFSRRHHWLGWEWPHGYWLCAMYYKSPPSIFDSKCVPRRLPDDHSRSDDAICAAIGSAR